MQFAHLNGINLHFQMIGAPPGRPVIIFINSLGTDFRIWRDVIVRLAGDYAIVAYDKRGHGLSDIGTTPYSLDDHVQDLAALMDHLAITRAVLCGISVGGLIAQGLYRQRPNAVEAMILSNTAPKIGTADMWNARIEAVESQGLEAIADTVLERWFTPQFRRGDNPAFAGYRNMLSRTPAAGYAGTCAALRDADLTAEARGIDVPVMCVAGDQDGSTPSALVGEMAKMIPGALFQEIPRSGHLPCIEEPAIYAEAMKAFLARIREA